MPKPRRQQISISETPYYHLVSRCVRRSFLCGKFDTYNFEHRRDWILQRLAILPNLLKMMRQEATHQNQAS